MPPGIGSASKSSSSPITRSAANCGRRPCTISGRRAPRRPRGRRSTDARAWFEQALGALETLPESRSTLEQAFEIRLELRPVLTQLGEFRRALELPPRGRGAGRTVERRPPARPGLRLHDEHPLTARRAGRGARERQPGAGDRRAPRRPETPHPRHDLSRGRRTTTAASTRGWSSWPPDNLAAMPPDWVYEFFGSSAAAIGQRSLQAARQPRPPRQVRRGGRARSGGDPARRADAAMRTPSAWPTTPRARSHLVKGDWAKAHALIERQIAVLRTGNIVGELPSAARVLRPGPGASRRREPRRSTGSGKASSSSSGQSARGSVGRERVGLLLAGSRLSAARPARRGAAPGPPRG